MTWYRVTGPCEVCNGTGRTSRGRCRRCTPPGLTQERLRELELTDEFFVETEYGLCSKEQAIELGYIEKDD